MITYLLNVREPVSWQDIKNHFPDDYARGIEESNQRKFERDKAELISLGIPIEYQSGPDMKKEGYFIEKEKFFLPEIAFSPQESSLLMLSAGAVLENKSFPYRISWNPRCKRSSASRTRFSNLPRKLPFLTRREENRVPVRPGSMKYRMHWIEEKQSRSFTMPLPPGQQHGAR